MKQISREKVVTFLLSIKSSLLLIRISTKDNGFAWNEINTILTSRTSGLRTVLFIILLSHSRDFILFLFLRRINFENTEFSPNLNHFLACAINHVLPVGGNIFSLQNNILWVNYCFFQSQLLLSLIQQQELYYGMTGITQKKKCILIYAVSHE